MKAILFALLLLGQRPVATPLQSGSISGRLLNTDGTPAVRIRVGAMPAPDSPAKPFDGSTLMTLAETDSDGRFRLTDVPVGPYFIVAGSLDAPTFYPRGTVAISAKAVSVTAGAKITNIDFRIESASASFSVSGRVNFEAASRPAFSAVQVQLTGGVYFSDLNATAGADGTFEISHVRPGAYTLNVFPVPFFTSKSIVVVDKDVKGIEVVIPWTTDVTGAVSVDGNAGPVPQFSLMFNGAARQVSGYLSSQVLRATLAEGNYAVTANGLPSGFYVKSMDAGSVDLLSEPYRVAKDIPITPIRVTLGVSTPSPWVTVSGRIGRPTVANEAVMFSGATGSTEVPLSADGSFVVAKILPGQYSVNLRSPVAASSYQQSLALVVPTRDLNGITLPFPSVREISGRVLLESDGPLVRPTLMITNLSDSRVADSNGSTPSFGQLLVSASAGRSQTTLSLSMQPDGSFKTTLPEGRYQVMASLPSNTGGSPGGANGVIPYVVKELRYGTTDLLKDPIIVTSEPLELTVKLASTIPISKVKVSGRVTGLTAVANATVTLANSSFSSNPVAKVAADGSFEFPQVFSGNYIARVSTPSMNSSLIPGLEVTVSDRDVTNLQIVAPRQREVTGKITMEGKGPLPTFSVILSSGTSGPGATQQYINVNPQADGSFKLQLAEGNWKIGQSLNLPPGYSLKSMTYGSVNVLNSALSINVDLAELRVTIASPNAAPVKVRGKVTNIETLTQQNPALAVVMNGQGYSAPLQTPILADGSFEFAEVFPGSYTARLSSFLSVLGTISTSVNVGATDIKDVEIKIPRTRDILGKVSLEGKGPMPRFFVPLLNDVGGIGANVTSVNTTLNISPAADGTFKVTVPEIERRAGVVNGLPPGYVLKSIMYGAIDITKEPMKFTSSSFATSFNDELRIVVSTPDKPPVKVSGKVSGLEASQSRGLARIRVNGNGYMTPIETILASDGTFEFSDVYPGTYSAAVTGVPVVMAAGSSITVGSVDVKDIVVNVQIPIQIRGRMTVEGNAPFPRFSFISAQATVSGLGIAVPPNSDSALSRAVINISPNPDGTFLLSLPLGERPLGTTTGLAPGYSLKSVSYGSADLLRGTLKISRSDPAEFMIVLSATGIKPVSVSGRVEGLDAAILARGASRVLLTSATYAGNQIATLASDGTFEFSSVYPATYNLQVVGTAVGTAAPAAVPGQNSSIRPTAGPQLSNVVVADKDVTNLRIVVSTP